MRRRFAIAGTTLGAVIAALSLTAGGTALAEDGARQRIKFTFDQQAPGVPTGVQLAIDYVNPDDENAKPYAVETLVETLAAGGRFDTSVPELCQASDAELMARGAAACPAGSQVGDGELDLDTGIEGPQRIIHNKVTELNNEGELILLVEQEGGSRTVARSRIEDGALYAGAPPLPGGPPDGYTAIKRLRVELKRIVKDGRGYVTSPPTCSASGSWTNSIAFTYRDGVTQTAASPSPCVAAARDRRPPHVSVSGVPKRCVSRAFVARVSVRDAGGIARAVTRLNGRKLRTTSASRFRLRINARALRPGRQRLTVTARDRNGNQARRTVTFRRCPE